MLLNVHTHHVVSGETSILSYHFGQSIDYQQLYSVGVHPYFWKGEAIDPAHFERELSSGAALGEAGLDARSLQPIENQLKLFLWQIELAQSYRKTVIVHCVRAWDKLLFVLKRYHQKVSFIIHQFNQNELILKELIRFGAGISVGLPALTEQSNAGKLLPKIPQELLFIETDDCNCGVVLLYQGISQRLRTPLEVLQAQQQGNWQKFGLLL